MPPDALAADSSFLTIDQAVANLDAAEIEREDEAPAVADAASPEGANTEAEPAAEDASEPETAIADGEADKEEGEAEGDEPQLPALSPPALWNAEDKEAFGELPRHLQERLLAKETESNRAVSQKMEEAAAARKAADGEASRIAQLTGVLDKLLPQAMETFKDRWENVDWNAVVDQRGAEEALKLRNQMETERGQVQQLQAAKSHAEEVTTHRFVAERFDQLKTVCPDLVDGKVGEERQLKLVQFLGERKIPAETVIRRASAEELSIAYDAMRWRQAQADARTQASAPKTQAQNKPATPARPSVKPTAAPARAGSPQSARMQQLSRKAHLTVDEAVELMDLQDT